jgi:hypothetical protein
VALCQINQWCKRHRHGPIAKQHQALARKLSGHYAYYGLTGNFRRLDFYRDRVGWTWRKWLDRRSYEAAMTWERFQRLLAAFPLPPARIVHSVYARTANP